MLIAVYNLKGGVGKTTTVVNLAFASAQSGARTLIWDLDAQAAATYYLRLKPSLDKGSKGLFAKKKGAFKEVCSSEIHNLYAIPADYSLRKIDQHLKNQKGFASAVKPLSKAFDAVLFDCPPMAGAAIEDLLGVVDAVVVPLIPTTLSMRTFHQMKQKLAHPKTLPFFNLVDRRKRMHRDICEYARLNDEGFLETIIPSASDIEKMGLECAPLGVFASNSPLVRSYQLLWDEIVRAAF